MATALVATSPALEMMELGHDQQPGIGIEVVVLTGGHSVVVDTHDLFADWLVSIG